jgi:Tol biopolymer transport system component
MTRVPTLVAVLAANAAIGTALRLMLPYTLAESGERYRYYAMSLFFPLPECPSFHCFRILPPALVSLLPHSIVDSFLMVGVAALVLAATMLWALARALGASTAAAHWTMLWFWGTWGAILSLADPLLITDPLQLLWSTAALYLLVTHHFVAALLVLVTGAAVKETVLLVPMIFALYAVLVGDRAASKPIWLAVLIAAPVFAWLWIRVTLTTGYGYVSHEDEPYVRATYFFGLWLPNLGPFPLNLLIASLYMFGAFGAAWVLGIKGLFDGEPRWRALAAACVLPMVFLSLFQVPDRALASFPYAVLPAAGLISSRLPWLLGVALLAANLALTVRMNTAIDWLPRMPWLLGGLLLLTCAALWSVARRSHAGAAPPAPSRSTAWRPTPVSSVPRFWREHVAKPLVAGAVVCAIFATSIPALAAWRGKRATTLEVAVDSSGARLMNDGLGSPGLGLSRDGEWLATVLEAGGERAIWVTHLPTGNVRRVDGTEGASAPFWSSDARTLGFFATGALHTIDRDGGSARRVAAAPQPRGGAFRNDGAILFVPDAHQGLMLVTPGGGMPVPVTRVDRSAGEVSHHWPVWLPDERHFLFLADRERADEADLMIGAVDAGLPRRLASGTANVAVAEPHLLVVARGATVWMHPFDPNRQLLIPTGQRIADSLMWSRSTHRAAFAVAGDRLLLARRPPTVGRDRADTRWVDRTGEISPDRHGDADYDTSDGDHQDEPRLPPRAAAAAREILQSLPERTRITDVSSDGNRVVFQRHGPQSWGLWMATLNAPEPKVLVDTAADEVDGALSPDGRWLAYTSTVEGSSEVFVRPMTPEGASLRVSAAGGAQPRWRADGRELVYVADDRAFYAVPVDPDNDAPFGAPRLLFTRDLIARDAGDARTYTMTDDAQRFRLLVARAPRPGAAMQLISNWRHVIGVSGTR